jgi:hypothetical protein
MRPKRIILVIGIRPELRFVLRIVGFAVIPAETMLQLTRCLDRSPLIDLAIVDKRDRPKLASEAVSYLAKTIPRVKTLLITSGLPAGRELVCDRLIRDGAAFMERLRSIMAISLARPRGPRKGAQRQLVCQ